MGQCAHLRNYATLADCEVVALAEVRPLLAQKVADHYGVARVYPNAEEMLASERLDGIVAVQQLQSHGQIIPGLYRAGIPVLTEKPLAASIEAGEKMLSCLAENGSWHMVAYHKRCDPAVLCAKNEIDRLKQTGELGKMRYVRITMPEGDWIAGGFNDLIRTDEPAAALQLDPPASDMDEATNRRYRGFVNFYIHQVNLLRHLLGESYRVTHADPSGILFVAQSQSGVTGIIEMTPYRTSLDWQESALIGFDKGYVQLELPAPLAVNRPGRVEIFRDAGKDTVPQVVVPQLPPVHAMRQQAINFLRAIRGEMKPPCEAAEALEDLKVARDYIGLWKASNSF